MNNNIEDIRKQLYATVDKALEDALTQLSQNTVTKGKELTVEQVLAHNPIQTPQEHICNVLQPGETKKRDIKKAYNSLGEDMNIDDQAPVDTTKLSQYALDKGRQLIQEDLPQSKQDPVVEMTTELASAISKFVNRATDTIIDKVTKSLNKAVALNLLHTFNSVSTKPTKEERAEQLILGGIQQNKAISEALKGTIKQVSLGFDQPDQSLKEDDSKLERATDKEINQLHHTWNRKAEAKRRIAQAKTMKEINDVIDEFVYDDPTPSEYHDISGENA
jgi:hydrogenase maturation factor HypF (carbamoyltransferase family)